MEWSRLSGDSIRLMLEKDEIAELGLSSAYKGKIYRSEIERLLEMNFHESGFLISGCRALVQIFPKKTGGIEILITKLDEEDSGMFSESYFFAEDGETSAVRHKLYFIFEEADALINGCLRIKPVESNLFYAKSGEFVVSIPAHKCPSEIKDILCEYAYETDDEEIEDELVFVTKNVIAKIQQSFKKRN
ncbi:MAG: hypothetical protein PHY15_06180 [Eubacteriales bacterium]|nr:hypothetical protein [Eubacteriales bacterium]MDD4474639.1 hypothetical protein [Eubacteriales bacterium]